MTENKPGGKNMLKYALPLILFITALVYLRAVFNDFVVWEDSTYIADNPLLKNLSWNGIREIFSSLSTGDYHPLTTAVMLIEFQLFKLNPLPWHLINVLLHLINVFLVFRLAKRLSGHELTAAIVSMLFALHPMHVEPVAWISQLGNVLFACVYLLALLMYLRYMDSGFKGWWFVLTLLFFTLSLLSKSAAVTLPFLIVAIDIFKRRKLTANSLMEKIPLLLLMGFFGVLSLMAQQLAFPSPEITAGYSFINRLFFIPFTIMFYLVKAVVPFDQAVVVNFPPLSESGALPWYYYASLPVLIAILWLVLRKSSFRREALFGFAFFLVTIALWVQIVPFGKTIVSESYTYLPYIGLFYIGGQWVATRNRRSIRKTALGILGAGAIIFTVLTFIRIGVWKNGETLFTEIIEDNPDFYEAYYNRGIIRETQKNYPGALADYNKALQYNREMTDAYFNRGGIYYMMGDIQNALSDYTKTIEMDPRQAKGYYNRGNVYDGLGRVKDAMEDYNKAIEIDPDLAEAYINRCLLKSSTGDHEGALRDINRALKLSPDNPEIYFIRAYVNAGAGDHKAALPDYDQCLKMKPNYDRVLFNRGNSRWSLNDSAGACDDWNRAYSLGMEAAKNPILQHCR